MTNEEFIASIKLPNEEWRDVVGYEGYYMVSSFGRIISLERHNTRLNGTRYSVKRRLLKPNTSKHNGILYSYICFRKNCSRIVVGIHRLVAMAFLPNPCNYPEIDHIDRDGTNNNVSNLRWCTRSMNMRNERTVIVHKQAMTGRKLPSLRKPVVKLKHGVLEKTYDSVTEASKDGYSISAIVRVCKNRGHTHKGFKWMYLSQYKSLAVQ